MGLQREVPMTALAGQLSHLETSGLIRLARVEPDLEYLFRHNLVQQAAYGSLLDADRKRLHLAVGQALEQIFCDRLDELAPALARHFREAGENEKALTYYTRAAETALASYANQEAESHYHDALDLSPSPEARPRLLVGLGEAVYRQGHFRQALQFWREAIELHQAAGDLDSVASLYARSARAAWYGGDTPAGLQLCLEGLQAVEGAAESRAIARLIHETARAYHFNGLSNRTRALCLQALDMAERLGAVDVQADALTTLAVLPDEPAHQALATLQRAVELAEEGGFLAIAARANHNLGYLTNELEGDLRRARERFLRSLELARRRGSLSEQVNPLMSVMGNSLGLGEIAAAEELLPELQSLVEMLADPELTRPGVITMRAYILMMKGDVEEARRLLLDVLANVRQIGDLQWLHNVSMEMATLFLTETRFEDVQDWSEVETWLHVARDISSRGLGSQVGSTGALAVVRARQGQADEAARLLQEARQHAVARRSAWHEHNLLRVKVELDIARQNWSQALAGLEKAAALELGRGQRWQWARTVELMAEIHARRGEPADLARAQVLLRQARDAFLETGAPLLAAEAGKRLASLRSELDARALAHGQAARELAVAGRIQAGLLPASIPELPGWQLAAVLEPARETSGDFYDFIPLPGGRLGLLVADVSDKGAGAALYMALSRTLLRTYAAQHPDQPGEVLAAVNRRLLGETHTGMFVTVFYGVLDPVHGTLLYGNAGHNPPVLLRAAAGGDAEWLSRTGMALGATENTSWEEGRLSMATGDTLLLYTDGLPDAQGTSGELLGTARLLQAARAHVGLPADQLQEAVLAEVHRFVGSAPRFDDLTLMVVVREGQGRASA
jgi:serine phosphatase RsbU (regulator of sigma subunit)/tetratricopeptide (TPR) repeat protein